MRREFGVPEAIALAELAHAGQVDKSNSPYIEHVRRVVSAVSAYGDEIQMAAALHDVVEDSSWTLEALGRKGVPQEVLNAVDALTRRPAKTMRMESDEPRLTLSLAW